MYMGAIIHPHNIDFIQSLQFNNAETHDGSYESEIRRTLPQSTRGPPGRPKKYYIRTRIETTEGECKRIDVVDSLDTLQGYTMK